MQENCPRAHENNSITIEIHQDQESADSKTVDMKTYQVTWCLRSCSTYLVSQKIPYLVKQTITKLKLPCGKQNGEETNTADLETVI